MIMKILEATALFYGLAKQNLPSLSQNTITKVAFDTRKIDQETEYNPRRGLQYYHRSEGFIKKDTAAVVSTFMKLKAAIDQIKNKYIGAPEWLDSHCRVLSAALDRILRAEQQDYEFFEPQLNYLEELVDVRYRLKLSDIETYGEEKLKDIILSKDEPLLYTQIFNKDEPLYILRFLIME